MPARIGLPIIMSLLLALLLVVVVPAGGAEADRVAGDSRYATSVAIAQRGFDRGADIVYVANGDDSPDAAGTLSHELSRCRCQPASPGSSGDRQWSVGEAGL